MIKHLILLKIRNMLDINTDLLQCSIKLLIKMSGKDIKIENMQLIGKIDKEFVFYYVLLIILVNMHGLFL